jgi:hypothetical protein
MEKLNFKLNKKTNKTDLIIAKIHELKENDYGDPSRLQMICTYLEEDVSLDQSDTLYLKKICKEYAQTIINENKSVTQSPKNDKLKEQSILSNEKTNQLVIEKKQPFKKFIYMLEKKIKNRNLDSKKTIRKKEIKKNKIIGNESNFNKNNESHNDKIDVYPNSSSQNSDVTVLQKEDKRQFNENFDKYSNNYEQFQNQQKLELEDITEIIEDVKTKKKYLLSEIDKIHSFKKTVEKLLLRYDETQMKLDYVRSDLDSIQLIVSKKLSEVLGLQKDLIFLKDELTSLNN